MAILSEKEAIEEKNDKLTLYFRAEIDKLGEHITSQTQKFDEVYVPIRKGL
jgi:hypothetical protein